MLSRVIVGRWGKEYYFRVEARSGRSVSEMGIRTYCHKILCDVLPIVRRASIQSVLWFLWGVYWVC